jgi:hypothetical protein
MLKIFTLQFFEFQDDLKISFDTAAGSIEFYGVLMESTYGFILL